MKKISKKLTIQDLLQKRQLEEREKSERPTVTPWMHIVAVVSVKDIIVYINNHKMFQFKKKFKDLARTFSYSFWTKVK